MNEKKRYGSPLRRGWIEKVRATDIFEERRPEVTEGGWGTLRRKPPKANGTGLGGRSLGPKGFEGGL